jgi:hypothetical protein
MTASSPDHQLTDMPAPITCPAQGHTSVNGVAPGLCYEIRAQGALDQRWTAWFDGLQVNRDGNQTVISGPVADQTACTAC